MDRELTLKQARTWSMKKWNLYRKHPKLSTGELVEMLDKKYPVLAKFWERCGLCERLMKHRWFATDTTFKQLDCTKYCPISDKGTECCKEYVKWRRAKEPQWRKYWANKLYQRIKAIKIPCSKSRRQKTVKEKEGR